MKRHSLHESLKRLVPELPRLVPAGAGSAGSVAPTHFSSSGGGGGGGRFDDADDDYYDDVPEDEPATPRRDEPQATAARRRTVQSQPDDRYWTDYLRIALPVIGLLLVIAVFWYWAQQLIDDDSNGDLTATEPGIAEVVDSDATEAPPASTPDTTQSDAPQGQQVAPPTLNPSDNQQGQPQPTVTPEVAVADPDAAGGEAPDSQLTDVLEGLNPESGGETGGGGIEADMDVVVSDEGGGLSLRTDPTTLEENVVTNLDAGTELTVVSGPTEAEDFVWWQVVVTATGEQGWVVEEFIEPAA